MSVPLFTLLGGRGEVLREALGYATVLFSGALAVWLFNTLASILRGSGDMRVPSLALAAAALLQITLGGALGLGWGPVPRLGMPGVALGQILAQALGAAGLFWYLRSGRGRLRLRLGGLPLRREQFGDILKVGAVACLSPLQSVTTMLLLAGFVAQLGVLPLAGFAIGQRLEFLMSTVAFGIGLASVPMVGMAIGAGRVARARRVAWTAGGLSAAVLGAVGLVVALFPDLWVTIFTRDEQVLAYLCVLRRGPDAVLRIAGGRPHAGAGGGRDDAPAAGGRGRQSAGGARCRALAAVCAQRRIDAGLRQRLRGRAEAGPLGWIDAGLRQRLRGRAEAGPLGWGALTAAAGPRPIGRRIRTFRPPPENI